MDRRIAAPGAADGGAGIGIARQARAQVIDRKINRFRLTWQYTPRHLFRIQCAALDPLPQMRPVERHHGGDLQKSRRHATVNGRQEGVADMFSYFIKKSFSKNIYTKIVALIAKPVMKDFKSRVDPGRYNGASLLGLKGVVVKSHGNADIDAFFQAIKEAYLEAHAKITEKISVQLTRELEEHK